MAVIDELAILMDFQLSSGSLKSLQEAENVPERVRKAVESLSGELEKTGKGERNLDKTTKSLNKSFDKSSKLFDTTYKGGEKLVSMFTRLGTVSMITSGVMGAWSVNASQNAVNLSNLSHSLQLTTSEIQAMGSVYERLGGTMQDFVADADSYQRQTGLSLTLERMVDLGDRFSRMSERDALNQGRAWGLSERTIFIARNYGNELGKMVNEAERFGHVVSDGDLQKLNEMNSSWMTLKGTFSGLSSTIQAGMSEGVTPALETVTKAFSDNKEAYKEFAEYVGQAARTAANLTADLMNGKLTWQSYVGSARNEDKEKENAKIAANRSNGQVWEKEKSNDLQRRGTSKQTADYIAARKNHYRELSISDPENPEWKERFEKEDDYYRPQKYSPIPKYRDRQLMALKDAGWKKDEIDDFRRGRRFYTSEMLDDRKKETHSIIRDKPEITYHEKVDGKIPTPEAMVYSRPEKHVAANNIVQQLSKMPIHALPPSALDKEFSTPQTVQQDDGSENAVSESLPMANNSSKKKETPEQLFTNNMAKTEKAEEIPLQYYLPQAIPNMAGAASIDGDTNTTNNSSVTYNQTFHVEANGFSPEQIGQAIIGEAQTMSKINDPRVDQSVHR